ncbi:MAG TPA: hypothetical protein VMT28_01835 [Terriglobales bacterium]|jgi:hypothetical protein|nr:hypothetical protein [Terriglobales bacterium]
MTAFLHRALHWRYGILAFVLLILLGARPASAEGGTLSALLTRTSKQVSAFLDQFSEVKCTEQVTQEKLGKDAKIELKEESTYDYLVILTNPGGELSLDESRLPVHEAKPDKKNTSLLVTNGFATLFLVFHPYYVGSFQFTQLEDEVVDGRRLSKIAFQHIPGTRSPAALALRGREYPLELSGTALIDPQTGVILKIVAGIASSMQDVGLNTLNSEVDFAPVSFRDAKETYWFPALATVEVETPRQHWRNLHRFTDYKRFSVSTEEQVANK